MRARFGLAQCLERLGEREAAAGHYQELLRLNPNDNQGERYVLLPFWLTLGRDADAARLLGQYEDDVAAEWVYGRALWRFRQEGDGPRAREALRTAVDVNPYVPAFLLNAEAMPRELPPHYALGSLEEAASCAFGLREAWEASPGALAWLRQRVARTPGMPRGRPRFGRQRHGRRR